MAIISMTDPANPYTPPSTAHPSDNERASQQKQTKPIIPAVIGLFTYGSTSPFALVLCVEQYLRRATARPLVSTHFALPLSILGTMGWIAFKVLIAPDTLNFILGRNASSYGTVGLGLWIVNALFLVWAYWRLSSYGTKAT